MRFDPIWADDQRASGGQIGAVGSQTQGTGSSTPEERGGADEGEITMTYVIVEPCIDVKDKACVEVCPVDCIYEGPDQLFIHPDECIDCGACEPVCPVKAIFVEDETPEQWKHFIALNKQFFVDNPGVKPCTTRTEAGEPGGSG